MGVTRSPKIFSRQENDLAVDVFISYARLDRNKVEPIRERLVRLGFKVFFDIEGIDAGAPFPVVIDDAVKSAKAVLGCWSPTAFTRPWVMQECRVGLERGVLVPVSIEKFVPLAVPTDFFSLNCLDLTNWKGNDAHEDWRRVLAALARLAGRGAIPTEPASPELEPHAAPEATGVEVEYELKGHTYFVHFARFSSDGTRVITLEGGQEGGSARLWDMATGELVTRVQHRSLFRSTYLLSADISPNGNHIVTGAEDRTARIWALPSGYERTRLSHDKRVKMTRFSPDGSEILTCAGDSAWLWGAASGLTQARIRHDNTVTSSVFDSTGRLVLTASCDWTARVSHASDGSQALSLKGHENTVGTAAFSRDDRYIATASEDSTARIWDASTGELICAPLRHAGTVLAASFSPDGRKVATAGSDETAGVWDIPSGKQVLQLPHEKEIVFDAMFSPGGGEILTVSGTGVNGDTFARLWSAASGREIARLHHESHVAAAAFSPDGNRIVTASADRTARIWRVVRTP